MRKVSVIMRKAKFQSKPKTPDPPIKGTLKWRDPQSFMAFLKSPMMLMGMSQRGFITLKKWHYTEANWELIIQHTRTLHQRGSIHNYRTHKGGRSLSIKLRPYGSNRGVRW